MKNQYSKSLYINSLMYNDTAYVSPKDYQKTAAEKKVHKKIRLGKPITGKQKMNLNELKALSRQIKPHSYGYTVKNSEEYDIMSICKSLKENMFKVKSRALHHLKHSTSPKDIKFYHDLMNTSPSSSSPQQPTIQPDFMNLTIPSLTDDEDDNSSTHSQDIYSSFLSLYTPNFMMQEPIHTNNITVNTLTEDHINFWLQQGGNTSSPITLATDQELADLLEFDL